MVRATPAADTGLEVGLDRRLPGTLPVGSETAVLCVGTCFHREVDVEALWITVDGARHRPAAQRTPRPDRAKALGARAYRSGFWGIVPVIAPDGPGAVELGVEVRLRGGRTETAPLGRIAVRERPEPVALSGPERTGEPLIVVCMTTFNPNLDLFRAQVESIREQTDGDWVCVISDDCSDPAAFEAIQRTVAGDERFVVSRAESHLGFYRNFERVLATAPRQAELIALCDHDDYWYPEKLSTLRAALGGARLAYSDARRVDAAGNVRAETLWRGRRPNHSNLASLLISNTVPGASCLFRREVIERALPFPEGPGWDFHDHWLALVALALGDVAYVDRALYDYVQHPGAVLGRVTSRPASRGPRSRATASARLGSWRAAYFTGYLHVQLLAEAAARPLGARAHSPQAPRGAAPGERRPLPGRVRVARRAACPGDRRAQRDARDRGNPRAGDPLATLPRAPFLAPAGARGIRGRAQRPLVRAARAWCPAAALDRALRSARGNGPVEPRLNVALGVRDLFRHLVLMGEVMIESEVPVLGDDRGELPLERAVGSIEAADHAEPCGQRGHDRHLVLGAMLLERHRRLPDVAAVEVRSPLAACGHLVEGNAVVQKDDSARGSVGFDVDEVGQHLLEKVEAVDERKCDGPTEQIAQVVAPEELVAGELVDLRVRKVSVYLRLGIDPDARCLRERLCERYALVDADLDVVRGLQMRVNRGEHLVVDRPRKPPRGLGEVRSQPLWIPQLHVSESITSTESRPVRHKGN